MKPSDKHARYLFLLTMLSSILLILAGISSGQPGEVMTKAIRICLECVGIG